MGCAPGLPGLAQESGSSLGYLTFHSLATEQFLPQLSHTHPAKFPVTFHSPRCALISERNLRSLFVIYRFFFNALLSLCTATANVSDNNYASPLGLAVLSPHGCWQRGLSRPLPSTPNPGFSLLPSSSRLYHASVFLALGASHSHCCNLL